MKVSLFGLGKVGISLSLLLAQKDYISELTIHNRTEEKAKGIALDLKHARSILGNKNSQGYSLNNLTPVKNSDIIIFTMGVQRKDGQKRIDVSRENLKMTYELLKELNEINNNAIFILVTNPVDIITYMANKILDAPSNKIIGLGTLIDTTRYRSFAAEEKGLYSKGLTGCIVGEHGQNMIKVQGSDSANGIKINVDDSLIDETQKAGGELIKLMQGTYFTAPLSIMKIVDAINYDKKQILPLTTRYNFKDIGETSLSLPVVVGKNGAEEILYDRIPDETKEKLHSAVTEQIKKQEKLLNNLSI